METDASATSEFLSISSIDLPPKSKQHGFSPFTYNTRLSLSKLCFANSQVFRRGTAALQVKGTIASGRTPSSTCRTHDRLIRTPRDSITRGEHE